MDYRCGIIGGTLQVERRAAGGTVIRCIVPTVPIEAAVAEPPGDRPIGFII
jgi:hypothetical protein